MAGVLGEVQRLYKHAGLPSLQRILDGCFAEANELLINRITKSRIDLSSHSLALLLLLEYKLRDGIVQETIAKMLV